MGSKATSTQRYVIGLLKSMTSLQEFYLSSYWILHVKCCLNYTEYFLRENNKFEEIQDVVFDHLSGPNTGWDVSHVKIT